MCIFIKWELRKILKEGARLLGVDLNDNQLESFLIYLKELKEWNKRVNLTSIKGDREIIERHFLDSLTPLEFLKPDHKVLDIGSGAGFPGIPMKIASPSLDITLVDSAIKKVSFQRHIIRTLKIEGVQAVHARIEDLIRQDDMREMFDAVISRAFSHLKEFVRVGASFLKEGGLLIAIKGAKGVKEVKEAEDNGISLWKVEGRQLPFSQRKTNLFVFKRGVSRETC